jgi:hypothetical protein
VSQTNELPAWARVVRDLGAGTHRFRALLPGVWESPALERISPDPHRRRELLDSARVRIEAIRGFCWIDETVPAIVLGEEYYRRGSARDLYLDLLHELTHLRQHRDGLDVWDERLPYPQRPTEVEAYAVAVVEGRRLGMSEAEVLAHLSNPWMTADEVQQLLANVERWLARHGGGAEAQRPSTGRSRSALAPA